MRKPITFLLLSATFVLSVFAGLLETETATGCSSAFDELQDLFKVSLEKNEVAFISLPFSGVLFRVEDMTILIDPANLLSDEDIESLKAAGLDLLLYTHGHGDHLHLPTAQKIHEGCQPEIAADPSLVERIKRSVPTEKLIGAEPGLSYTIGKILLEAVKGEHIGPITLFKITVGDICLFHGGDSADVPLEKYPSDIAFLPTGAPSPTASPESAFKMAQHLKPQCVVAIHGSDEQNEEFKTLMNQKYPEIEVIIPEIGKVIKISVSK